MKLALRHDSDVYLPKIIAPSSFGGETSSGIPIAPGAGDNAGAALGLQAEPGDVVVSLGTSGTAFAVSETPTHDASGAVAGFADATGRFCHLYALSTLLEFLMQQLQYLGRATMKLVS